LKFEALNAKQIQISNVQNINTTEVALTLLSQLQNSKFVGS